MMKRTTLVGVLQLMLLLSIAQSYQFPLKISPNKRYLVDQKGKPFFYNGDTGWKIFMKLNKEEALKYLVDRKQKKFTVIQTMLTGFEADRNLFGEKPFADANDFATVNNAYFDNVEWVVQQADSLGLLIAIAPLWAGCCGEGYGGKGMVGPSSFMFRNGPVKSREFGVYVGKRFQRFNNILWISGGDIDPYEDRETMDQLALGIKSQAPHQLMTFHPSSSHSSSDDWPDTGWLDVVMTYTYFRGFNKAWTQDMPDVYEINFKEYARTPVKPFFIGESTYENEHNEWGSPQQVRKQAYWSVLSGGMGNAYGSSLWAFPNHWEHFLELPGGNSLRYYYELFHARPWTRLVPDPLSKIIMEGAGEYAHNDYAIAASDVKGKFIVAYLPSGRTFRINAQSIKGNKISASWYDPRTGIGQIIGNYKKKDQLIFKTPDEKDWILLIDRE